METRRKRINYRIVNDGSDEEAVLEDHILSDGLAFESFLEDQSSDLQANINDSELSFPSSIAPSDSISLIQPSQHSGNDISSQTSLPRKKARLEQSSWLWNMFKIIPRKDDTFIDSRTKKVREEKDIYCQYLGCNWKILESKRGGSTSNLALHLSSKHNITRDNPTGHSLQQSTILSFAQPSKVPVMSSQDIQQQLQDNVCRWGVITMQPFTAVETASFQKIFEDIPGINPPFQSATSYKRYIEKEFMKYRGNVKRELAETCQSYCSFPRCLDKQELIVYNRRYRTLVNKPL